ncbi:hypothetical protein GH714_015687 [Hevea brasiliensis]|uniref:Uncharacterized protein n=1 Tax=Hevea brasiliensis TaxID=3981 RepID=A0A6A6LH97_HEVBR|nr:hypothetical protein GH714_015687 [Hevea brasiliensis]
MNTNMPHLHASSSLSPPDWPPIGRANPPDSAPSSSPSPPDSPPSSRANPPDWPSSSRAKPQHSPPSSSSQHQRLPDVEFTFKEEKGERDKGFIEEKGERYKEFIEEIRTKLPGKKVLSRFDPTQSRFLLVKLSNSGDKSVTLIIKKEDVYLLGYIIEVPKSEGYGIEVPKSEDRNEEKTEEGREKLEKGEEEQNVKKIYCFKNTSADINEEFKDPEAEELPFEFNYDSLRSESKIRQNISICDTMENAISNLNNEGEGKVDNKKVAEALLVCIHFLSEAARFKSVEEEVSRCIKYRNAKEKPMFNVLQCIKLRRDWKDFCTEFLQGNSNQNVENLQLVKMKKGETDQDVKNLKHVRGKKKENKKKMSRVQVSYEQEQIAVARSFEKYCKELSILFLVCETLYSILKSSGLLGPVTAGTSDP